MASTNQDEVHAADLRSKVSAYGAKTPADGPQQLDFAHIIRVANSEIKDKGTP
jgi:hypothetical protein